LGSFIIGVIFYLLKDLNNENLKAFLMIGFLGGFTTFSAFSIDIMNLIYDKNYIISILYILGTVSFSIISVFFGFWITKLLST
jgi:CrcB protein